MLTTRQERNEQRKISLFAWLGIALIASLLTLALNWPAWAQERNQLTFCDTQDEITAATIYGDGAVTIINAKIPQACNTFIGTYIKGNTVETVKGFGKLWDITPVLVYAVGQHMQRVRPMEQWVAFTSPLIEAAWDGKLTDLKTKQWFESLMQPDNPTASCCGEADAVEADDFDRENGHYVAIVTNGRGIVATGTRISIPDAKLKWDKGNPTGHGIVFIHVITADEEEATQAVGTIYVYCYVTPTGS